MIEGCTVAGYVKCGGDARGVRAIDESRGSVRGGGGVMEG